MAQQWPELPLRTGALPFRVTPNGEINFLLIRRRGRRLWNVPKGQLMPDRTIQDAAAIEAFEEAGVRGQIHREAIESFRYEKTDAGLFRRARTVEVVLFPLEVEVEVQRWPEMAFRERRWFPQSEAPQLVAAGQLPDILARFNATSLVIQNGVC